MQGSAQALAEIVKNTENFLKESGEKLSQEDKAVIEQKLNEAKIKGEQLTIKAEQSKKELDKVVKTAIREETEKVLIQTCGARSCSFAENDEALQGLDLLPAVRRSKRWLAQRLEFGVFMYVIDQIWRIGLAELNIFFIKVDVQYYRSYRCTT